MISVDETKLREVLSAMERGRAGANYDSYNKAFLMLRSMLEQKPSYPDTLDEMSTLRKTKPIAYLAWRDGNPVWGEDCVCADAVFPSAEDDDRTSMPVYLAPVHEPSDWEPEIDWGQQT